MITNDDGAVDDLVLNNGPGTEPRQPTGNGTFLENRVSDQHHAATISHVRDDGAFVSVSPQVRNHLRRLTSLFLPMIYLSAFTILIVRCLNIPPTGSNPFLLLLPFPFTEEDDSTAYRIGTANANALSIMVVVVILTYLFVGLFFYRLHQLMTLAVIASFAFCWCGFTAYFLARVSPVIDYLTLLVVSANVSAVGVFSVFVVEEEAWFLGNVYLIFLGAILAWPFACLPELTVFFFLIWMAVWDVVAVLTPCGPLRWALAIQQQRIWLAESEFVLPRGMVIHASLYDLGLGDLIFFGVVVARATSIDYETTVSCVCAMLAAVILTVFATVLSERTIPALPLAMLLGICTYLASRFSAAEFVQAVFFRRMTFV